MLVVNKPSFTSILGLSGSKMAKCEELAAVKRKFRRLWRQWNRHSRATSSSSAAGPSGTLLTRETYCELELNPANNYSQETSNSHDAPDLRNLDEENKNIPAKQLSQEAQDIIVQELMRRQPNTLRPIRTMEELRCCFDGDKSKHSKMQEDHVRNLLQQWLGDVHHSVGDLIVKLKSLGRIDILQDSRLFSLTGACLLCLDCMWIQVSKTNHRTLAFDFGQMLTFRGFRLRPDLVHV